MGEKKTKAILVRVDQNLIDAVDEIAKSRHVTRSAITRNILANARRVYTYLESEWRAQHTPGMAKFEDDLMAEIIAITPKEYLTREVVMAASRVMAHVAEILEEGGDE